MSKRIKIVEEKFDCLRKAENKEITIAWFTIVKFKEASLLKGDYNRVVYDCERQGSISQ